MSRPPDPPVERRRVFYIPGYDPYPARRYRELYRSQGKEQARIAGYRLAVRGARGGPHYGWEVAGEIDGARVRARVDVLQWSDIVRDTMDQTVAGTYLQLIRTAIVYIGSGALRRMTWLRKGPVIAGLYPAVMLLLQLLMGLVAGWIVANAVAALLGFLLGWLLPGVGWGWVGVVVGTVVMVLVLRQFRAWDRHILAYYLMHDLAHTAQSGGAYPPEMDARIEAFADDVARALTQKVDEVLVVGHSSGAHLAVSVLARLLREGRVPADGPVLSLLTLGQAIPMVSFLPKAGQLRRDLHDLASSDRIVWIDISAPSDGGSFALCDPVAVSGVSPKVQRWPLVLSAAFRNSLSTERFKALRWRFFRLHFQYLCAFDKPEAYDYFRITAGPETLGTRFANRKPSSNRIDVRASRYNSMTP